MSSSDVPPPDPRPARPFVVRPTGGSNPAQAAPRPLSRISRPFIPRIVQAPARVAVAPVAPPPDTVPASVPISSTTNEPSAPSDLGEIVAANAGPEGIAGQLAPSREPEVVELPHGAASTDATDTRAAGESAVLGAPGVEADEGPEYTAAVPASDAWADQPLAGEDIARPQAALDESTPESARATAPEEPLAVLDAAAWPPAEAQLDDVAPTYAASPELPALVPGADAAVRSTPPAGRFVPADVATVPDSVDGGLGRASESRSAEPAGRAEPRVPQEAARAEAEMDEAAASGPPTRSARERGRSGGSPPAVGAVVPPAQAWPDDVWPDEGGAGVDEGTLVTFDTPAMLQDDLATDLAVATEGVGSSHGDAEAAMPDEVALAGAGWRPTDSPGGEGGERDTGEGDQPQAPWDVPVASSPAPAEADPLTMAQQTSAEMEQPAVALAARLQQLAEQVRAGALPAANVTAAEASTGMRDSEVLVALLGAVLKAGR